MSVATKTIAISSTSIFPGIIDVMNFLSITHLKLLVSALAAFIILRIPSLFEPHWYADEGIYAAITYGLEHGKQLYVNLWDNKPLLIYWLYGLGDATNRLLFIRLLNLCAGVISIVGIHLMLNHLKVHKKIHALSLAALVFLIGSPLIEGNITNAENLFIPLTIFGYYAILQKKPLYALSGLLFGVGFLLKFHPVFDFAAVLLYLLVTRHKFKHIAVTIAFFILPNMLQYLYLYFNGNLIPALQTIFLNNYGYTQSFSFGVRSLSFKTLLLVFLLIPLIALYLRKKISINQLLIGFMVLFEAYGVLFGGRQYLHYMIQVVPGFVLLSSVVMQKMSITRLKSQAMYLVVFLALVTGFLKLFFYGEGKAVLQSPSYYIDFYRFASGQQSYFLYPTDETLRNVDNALAKYQTRNIFIYTNNPWIYDVLEIVPPTKIVAGYHRTFIAPGEFMDSLRNAKTDLIVIDSNADPYDALDEYVANEYAFVERVDYYDVWERKR